MFDDLLQWAAAENGLGSVSASANERRFWEFHAKHPEVYRHLCAYARQWIRRGGTKCGISMLWERVRWECGISYGWDKDNSEGPQLNNTYRAYYARLMERDEPDLKGMFQFRQQIKQSTIDE